MANTSITPFEVLKTQVYPSLNQAMLKLIDHIVKTQQVRKHQERLVKKKILDELERKKIQREKEKEELGSDYYESDDEDYYKALNMNKEQVETILQNRRKREEALRSKASSRKNSKAKIQKVTVEKPPFEQESFNPISFLIAQLKEIKNNKQPVPAEPVP